MSEEAAPTAGTNANAAGVVREVLLAAPTAATLAGVVREVLLLSPPPAPRGGQTIVTVNSG